MAVRLEAHYLQGGDPGRLPQRGLSRPGRFAGDPRLRARQRVLLRQAPGRARRGGARAADRPGEEARRIYDPRKHPDRALRAPQSGAAGTGRGAPDRSPRPAKRAAASPLGLRPPGGSYVPAYLDLVRRHLQARLRRGRSRRRGPVRLHEPRSARAGSRRARPDAEPAAPRRTSRRTASISKGAVIVAEPNSGDVVAVVGGRDVDTDGFNRALDARRPIGSLVKPAVYLTAIETGRYNAATLIEDAPIELKLARRQHLGAAELRAQDLRPGAAGARARRVDESGDGAARARPGPAEGGRARCSSSGSRPRRRSIRRCCSAPWK